MRVKTPVLIFTLLLVVCVALAAPNSSAQEAKPPSIDEVIRRFATAESENKLARTNYTFTQDVHLVTVGEGGSITGQFKRVSDIVLDDKGNRIEKISYFPPTTLTVTITKEDLYDLANVQPFGLTIEDLPKYQVTYTGKEKIDELSTYVFTVKPKKFQKGERYFDGRIWVDDQDLQIVKLVGQAVPEDDNNQYPKFESYRENIDEKYWFPTYIAVDDVLEFKNQSVRIKGTIKITKYKKFSTGIRIADDDQGEEAKEGKKGEKVKKPDPPVVKKPDGN